MDRTFSDPVHVDTNHNFADFVVTTPTPGF